MIAFVPATREHAIELAPRLRPADVLEVETASGRSVGAALLFSVRASRDPLAAFVDGELAALFGVVPMGMLTRSGAPWFLSSARLYDVRLSALRASRERVQRWKSEYDHLVNWVDARNTVSIRWLKWLGFEIHDPVPAGPYGAPFHKFEWSKAHVRPDDRDGGGFDRVDGGLASR